MNIKTQSGDIVVIQESFRLTKVQKGSLHEVLIVSLYKPDNFIVAFSSKDEDIADIVFKQAIGLMFKVPSAQSLDFVRLSSQDNIDAFLNYQKSYSQGAKRKRGRPKKS